MLNSPEHALNILPSWFRPSQYEWSRIRSVKLNDRLLFIYLFMIFLNLTSQNLFWNIHKRLMNSSTIVTWNASIFWGLCYEIIPYTGCNRRNGPDFERVFLRSNYTNIIQNTYIQSWTVTEILAREKSGLLWCLHTVLVSVTSFSPPMNCIPMLELM